MSTTTTKLTFDLLRGGWMMVSSSLPSEMICLNQATNQAITTKDISASNLIGVEAAIPITDAGSVSNVEDSLFVYFLTQGQYWTYDGTSFGLSQSHENAITLKLSGTTDQFTAEVFDNKNTSLGFLVKDTPTNQAANTLSVKPKTNDFFSWFQLLARYQTPDFPINGLLPGEVLICGGAAYQGTAFIIKGSPIPAYNLNAAPYIQPVGTSSTGDLILSNIGSMKFGPSTNIVLSTADRGYNQFFYTNVPETTTDGNNSPTQIWSTVGYYQTNIAVGQEYEGNWSLYVDQGLLTMQANGQLLATPDDGTAPTDPLSFPNFSRAPISRLPNNEPIPGKVAYLYSGNLPPFFINKEPGGKVSFQDVQTGQFYLYNGTGFSLTNDGSLRCLIEMRYRNNMSTLSSGQVALFEKPIFGNQAAVYVVSHDIAPSNFPTDMTINSIAVGPNTTLDLLDSSGNIINQTTIDKNVADINSIVLSGTVAGLRIGRTVMLQGSRLSASSQLIDDFLPDTSGNYSNPATACWRTVLTVKDDKGGFVNGANVQIKMECSTDINVYVAGKAYPMTNGVPEQFTTDFSGTITLLNEANDVVSPVMYVQTEGMDVNEWTVVHLDQGLHEALMVVNESEIANKIPESAGRTSKVSPFKGKLKKGEETDLANALNALFSSINYDNGNESMAGDVAANAAAAGSAANVTHFKSVAAAHTKPYRRTVSTRHSKHKHFSLNFNSEKRAVFTPYTSGSIAMATFYDAARASSGGSIHRISLQNDSIFDWLEEVVNDVEDFIVSTVDDIEDAVEEGWNEVVDGLVVAFQYVKDGITYVIEGVITLVDDIILLGQWLLEKFGIAVDAIVDFFSYLFNWEAIQQTAAGITGMWNQGLQYMVDSIEEAKKSVDATITEVTKDMTNYLTETIKELDKNQYNIWKEDADNPSSDATALKNNYVMAKVQQDPNINDDSGFDILSKGLQKAVDDFVDRLTVNNPSDPDHKQQSKIEAVLTAFQTEAQQIISSISSIDSFDSFAASLLGILRDAISMISDIVIFLVDVTATIFEALLGLLNDFMTWEWPIPIVGDLFQEISGGLPLNGLNLYALLMAIPINVLERGIAYDSGKSKVMSTKKALITNDTSTPFIDEEGILIGWMMTTAVNTFFEPLLDAKAMSNVVIPNMNSPFVKMSDPEGNFISMLSICNSVIIRVLNIVSIASTYADGSKMSSKDIVGLTVLTSTTLAPFLSAMITDANKNGYVMTAVGTVNFGLSVAHTVLVGNDSASTDSQTFLADSRMTATATGPLKFCKTESFLVDTEGISGIILIAWDIICGTTATALNIVSLVKSADGD